MRGSTHLLFGLILAALATKYYPFDRPLLAVILMLTASVLPDIDERQSLLGRKVPVIGWFVRHRTFFHSILLGVAITIVVALFLGTAYGYAFGAAYLLHLLLDALTPTGVRPFWPSKLRIRGFVKVGGLLEKAIFIIAMIIFVWVLLVP